MSRTVRLLAIPCLSVAACVALALWIRNLVQETKGQILAAVQTQQVDVVEVLDVLKLVTHEVTVKVRARREHENWRGRVSVELEADVGLLYGVDLTNGRVQIDEQHPSYLRIVLPDPSLLYYHVDPSKIREVDVQISGLRTRTGAGQTQITLCILEDLPREIKAQAASPELLKAVREGCRQRIRSFLEAILPGEPWVEVRFESEAGSRSPSEPAA